MLYKDKYKAVKAAQPVPEYRDDFKNTDVLVEPALWLTSMYTRCFGCGLVTEYKDVTHEDDPPQAICSDECRKQSLEWYEEARISNGDGHPSVAAGLPEAAGAGSVDTDLSLAAPVFDSGQPDRVLLG